MGEEKHEDNEANDGIVHKVQYKALFNEHCRNYVPIMLQHLIVRGEDFAFEWECSNCSYKLE